MVDSEKKKKAKKFICAHAVAFNISKTSYSLRQVKGSK